MQIKILPKAEKGYLRLPNLIQKKAHKAILALSQNPRPTSLRTKKMKGLVDRWEARIDYSYRLTFTVIDDTLIIMTMGMHDEGLGKK